MKISNVMRLLDYINNLYVSSSMPFINKKEAFKLLDDMIKGTCANSCRQVWLRNIGYALKTETNPLKLTKREHKKMTNKIKEVKQKKKTRKNKKV